MKFTKEMQDRIIAFVELNGLYPQPCGATIASLCEACGFSRDIWEIWREDSVFSASLSRAREKFAQKTELRIVNSLVKAAEGVDYTKETNEATAQVVTEYDPKTGKKIKSYTTDKLVPKKAKRENIYYPPNVDAAKFVLTNIAPDRWKNKQETSFGPGGLIFKIDNEDKDMAQACAKK